MTNLRGAVLRGVLCLLAVVACLPAGTRGAQATAQPQSRATGVIIGRLVDGVTGGPLADAIVTLSGSGIRPQRVIVDQQGRFLFHELPAGAFTITATRAGYIPGAYGMQRPDGSGRTLELAVADRVLDAIVKMWRFATVSGRVLDDAGDPVPARVQAFRRTLLAGRWRLSNAGVGGTTDDRGVYRIVGLTPGEYAFAITSMTSTLPSSLLSVADAVKRMPPAESTKVWTELAEGGASGFVNDLMQGFPVTRVGDLMMQTAGNAIVGLDGSTVETYPTVWFPAASTPADASLVSIRAGDEHSGIDLRPTLTRALRISGTVIGPNGPFPHLSMRLVPAGTVEAAAEITSSLALSLTTSMTVTDANGAFTFLAVPPGQYVIRVVTAPRPPPEPPVPPVPAAAIDAGGMRTTVASGPAPPPMVATDPAWWAAAPVSVADKDTTGVVVTLRQGLRVTGRVEFEGTAARPTGAELRAVRVSMDAADGRTVAYPSAYQAQIDPTRRFYTMGLMAGGYVVRVDAPPRGWTLKSAMVNGRDIADVPLSLDQSDVDGLVLTFTDRAASLRGSVRNAQGRADDDATVLVFPVSGVWTDLGSNPRRMRSARASRSGTFSLSGIPAGEYFVIAVSDVIIVNWQEPAFLQKLSRAATRVTVAEGQSMTQDLTTTGSIVR